MPTIEHVYEELQKTREEIRTQLTTVQDRIKTLEVQITLMPPVEILTFKAKVLEALKNIDKDIDEVGSQLKEFHTADTKFLTEYNKQKEKVSSQLAIIKTKVAIYALLYSTVFAGIITLVINYLMNK